MKKTLSIVLLLLLVNCNTTKSTTQEENKPSIDNIVDVFKSVPWPKFWIDIPFSIGDTLKKIANKFVAIINDLTAGS